MERETIEKAAKEFCVTDKTCPGNRRLAFIAGAEWRIDSVWHNAKMETPSLWKLILIKDRAGDYDLGYELRDNTVLWAYVVDLIPNNN